MKREFGLDLIRAIATFFVIAVHFYLNSTYYKVPMEGKTMLILTIFRWLFFICVPLFIILTGYLKSDKKVNKDHYKGIKHILISYIFISIIVILFRKFYLNQKIRNLQALVSLFNFEGNNYSWYIEMYIGLFLIIPFLNILYKGCETKKNKQILIATLIAITSFSPLINTFKISKITIDIIPDWWNNLYPLVYYFIGCYIKEYQPKINKVKGMLVVLLITAFEAVATYVICYNSTFNWGFLGDYNCFFTVIITIFFFLIAYDVKCTNKVITKPITLISNVSLDIYLFSKISDNLIYPKINDKFYTPTQYIRYIPLIILASFMIALLLALLKKLLFFILNRLYKLKKRKA